MPPRVLFFGLPLGVFLVAAGVAVILLARRRCSRPRQVIYPPVYPAAVRPVEGGHMRRYIWGVVIVLIVAAAAAVSVAPVGSSGPIKQNWMKKPGAPAVPNQPAVAWKGNIERGCVVTLADSREEILDTIRHGFERELGLSKAPTPEFVANPHWVHFSETRREPLTETTPNGDTVVRVVYATELTQQGWAELAREQRAERTDFRLEIAVRVLGLLTILLGAVAAYLRLDDWTKGYYSGRLLLAGTFLVSLLGMVMVYFKVRSAP